MKKDFLIPSADELYALERAARRERSREMARLGRAGMHAFKAWLGSIFTGGFRHA